MIIIKNSFLPKWHEYGDLSNKVLHNITFSHMMMSQNLIPNPSKDTFWGVQRVENNFLKFVQYKIKGLHLVLDVYQIPYGHYTLCTGGLPHPVFLTC